MTKRFTAIILIANIIMGLLLYLSSQAILLHLASNHPVLTLTGVNLDKIYIGAVQPASSSSPLIITAYPNLPFYFLWLPLIVNAYFIIKVIKSTATAKKLPVFVSVGNINNVFTHIFLHSNNAPFPRCRSAKLHRNRGRQFLVIFHKRRVRRRFSCPIGCRWKT
jgi:hypothetical protein